MGTDQTADEQLTPFEGRDVADKAIKVTKTDAALSHPIAVDPEEFRIGDTVYVVIKAEVENVTFKLAGTAKEREMLDPEDIAQVRIETYATQLAKVLDRKAGEELLRDLSEKMREYELEQARLKDEKAGRLRLPGTEPGEGGGISNDDDDDGLQVIDGGAS